MITLSNLSKQYGGVTALNIPELTIGEGELVGLVGNNGAGKTTMMRVMLDLIQATSGYVTIDGNAWIRMNPGKPSRDPSWTPRS